MNIQQLQKLVDTDSWAMSPAVKQRIMENKMTMRDINFMEKTIMSMKLMRLKIDLELLVPTFQEGCMRISELKNQGETEVDIDYVASVFSDLTDLLVELQELTDDFGLADVVAVDEYREGR